MGSLALGSEHAAAIVGRASSFSPTPRANRQITKGFTEIWYNCRASARRLAGPASGT